MIKMLKNNWWLKLIALAFSIFLWLTITNTTDPEETYQISDIPIQFMNENSIYDDGMTYYVVGSGTTSVEVKVRHSQMKKISASDFKATVDLSKRYGQTGYVELNIELVNNIRLLEGNYKQKDYAVYIRTEYIKTQKFKINPEVSGKLAESYSYNVVQLNPNAVDITAPESVLETIGSAGVRIILDGDSEDIDTVGDIVVYDTNGNEINLENRPEITLGTSQVKVHIPVLKMNTIPIIVSVAGQNDVAEGYRYISYECDIDSVAVSGERSLVDLIDRILISGDAIDVTGASADVTVTVDINDYLPDGVVVDGINSIATITMKVEKLEEREIVLKYDNINIIGVNSSYNYDIIGDGTISIIVRGLAEELEQINEGDIALSINVSGLRTGEHFAVLNVSGLEEYIVSAPSTVVVKVTMEADTGDTTENTSESIPQTESESQSEESQTQEETESEGLEETSGEE
ncbi:MAG: hypothetical protein IJM37_07490 [Lachnospiraceae bacterium]|nr:hypothetical protein [Lachnospiraceae bacterium]